MNVPPSPDTQPLSNTPTNTAPSCTRDRQLDPQDIRHFEYQLNTHQSVSFLSKSEQSDIVTDIENELDTLSDTEQAAACYSAKILFHTKNLPNTELHISLQDNILTLVFSSDNPLIRKRLQAAAPQISEMLRRRFGGRVIARVEDPSIQKTEDDTDTCMAKIHQKCISKC